MVICKSFFVLSLCGFLTPVLHTQPIILNVWKGKIPNSVSNEQYREVQITSETGVRIRNVTEPTLTIYFPAKEKATQTAVLIIPGGGYTYVTVTKEGDSVAQWLNEHGITAAVLKYRLPSDSCMVDKTVGPLQDAQEAIRILRRNAKRWNLDPSKIGVLGFSAGGHLAATLSTKYDERVYPVEDSTSARPDFTILVYPVITMEEPLTHRGSRERLLGSSPSEELIQRFSAQYHVTQSTPPTFIVHALDDTAVPVDNSLLYIEALRKNRVRAELHLYQHGGHGFGLARTRKSTEAAWTNACIHWLEVNEWK